MDVTDVDTSFSCKLRVDAILVNFWPILPYLELLRDSSTRKKW